MLVDAAGTTSRARLRGLALSQLTPNQRVLCPDSVAEWGSRLNLPFSRLDQGSQPLFLCPPMSELPATLRPSALQSATDSSAPTLVPRPTQVVLRMGTEQLIAEPGTPLVKILPQQVNGSPVVAALLGRRPVSLTTQVAWDAEVEPIVLDSFEGGRIHRLSQALLLLEAAQRVAPDSELRLAHSVGFGRRVLVGLGYKQRAEELAQQLQQTMQQLVLEDRPAGRNWCRSQRGHRVFSPHRVVGYG